MKNIFILPIFVVIFLISLSSEAQKIEIKDDPYSTDASTEKAKEQAPSEKPKTGKDAAQKFFSKESADNKKAADEDLPQDHYLTVGLSFYVDSTSYRWGPDKNEDPAKWAFVVSYRMGEWVNSTDLLARIEYQQFDLDEDKDPKKLSFMPVLIFPDSRSTFPLYFGLGAGLGILFDQLDNESAMSLDYTVFGGGRLFNIVESTGFFAEMGLKNHLHLFSSGQLNGYYFTIGTVHTF